MSSVTPVEADEISFFLPMVLRCAKICWTLGTNTRVHTGDIRGLTCYAEEDRPLGDEKNLLSQYVRITADTGTELFVPFATLMALPAKGCLAEVGRY